VQAVGANNAGIAFAGVFYATHRTKFVKMVGEDGRALLPIYTNVVTGEYPLSLMLYFVVNKKPKEPLSPHLLEFMRFVTSRSGQRSAALIGHFPLTSKRQEESRLQFE
jgi:phosphate transport system substrate-binding protein